MLADTLSAGKVFAMADFSRTARLLQQGIDEGLHIGAQIHVSQNGRVLWDYAIGAASPDAPMTTDTLMLWMSSGKPLTAVALAKLVDEGQLDWDDPVAWWIPEFAQNGKEAVTLRHILTHTAGLRLADLVRGETWEDRLRGVCSVRLESKEVPGGQAAYHVSGSWFLLGEVIQRASGQSYQEFMKQAIFEPAGMEDCHIGLSADQLAAYEARAGVMISTAEGHCEPHPIEGQISTHAIPRPGSNAYGPVRMLGKFYQCLLDGGAPLLQATTLDYMLQRHRRDMMDKTFGHIIDMGLGFVLDSKKHGPRPPYGFGPHASPETFGHSGNQSSCAFADPTHGLAVAWVCNVMPGEPLHQTRAHALNSAIYEDLECC